MELTSRVGQTIKAKASVLADALALVWRKAFPIYDGRIKIDPTDPLRGELQGQYTIKAILVSEDASTATISLTLVDPAMRRESVGGAWEPCSSNYESFKQPIGKDADTTRSDSSQ